jgi:hypothetical protein
VLTHRPSEESGDPRISLTSDPIEEAVATAQAAAGDKDVGIFGACQIELERISLGEAEQLTDLRFRVMR